MIRFVATPPVRRATLAVMGKSGSPSGWYPDPIRRHELRYFDGTIWTPHVFDGTTRGTDPIYGTKWVPTPVSIDVVERSGPWWRSAATIDPDGHASDGDDDATRRVSPTR